MQHRVCRVLGALGLIVGLFAAGRVHAATRVALVSTCGGEAGAYVLALTEAKLRRQPDLVLVERAEVERVLNELKLVHCGPSRSRPSVVIGQRLGVEVFVSLETFASESEAVGLVVFDATNGACLWDTTLPAKSTEATVAEVAAQVQASCEKRRQASGGLKTICIRAVRNQDLPRDFDSFGQSLSALLQRRLVRSPSLAVIEPQYLEHAAAAGLTATNVAPTNPPAVVIWVDLQMSRGATGNGIRARASLSDGAGAKLGQTTWATSDDNNAADLSEQLVSELVKALRAGAVPALEDRDREANRFAREAEYFANAGNLAGGLCALEAAQALAPTNATTQARLAEYLVREAGELVRADPRELSRSLDLALRALDLVRAAHLRPGADPIPTDAFLPVPWLEDRVFWDEALRLAVGQEATTTDKLLAFQRAWHDLQWEIICRWSLGQVKDSRSFSIRSVAMIALLLDLEKLTPSSDAWTADTVAGFEAWLALAERYPLVSGDHWQLSIRPMNRLCCQVRGPSQLCYPHLNQWTLQPENYRRLGQLFERMRTHLDPVVQSYGYIGQLSLALRGKAAVSPEDLRLFEAAKRFIQAKIADPGRLPTSHYRSLLYSAMLDLIDSLPDPALRKSEYAGLFEFMLARREIAYWVARTATDPHGYTYRQYESAVANEVMHDVIPHEDNPLTAADYPVLIQNVERVMDLYHADNRAALDVLFWSFNTGSFERELAWIQRDLQPPVEGADPDRGAVWEDASVLFDTAAHRGGAVVAVTAGSNAVYAITRDDRLQCVRIPLDGAPSAPLGEGMEGATAVTALALTEGQLFVGTTNGIYVIAVATGKTRHVGKPQGLPSERVQAMAGVDGTIFAALGEPGREFSLVVCDLKTDTCKELAKPTPIPSKEGSPDAVLPSAGGAGGGFIVTGMFADPARHRVVFTVGLGQGVNCAPAIGLWQIEAATGRLTQLLQLYHQPLWAGLTDEHNLLIHFHQFGGWSCGGASWGVLAFDLATDRARWLFVNQPWAAGPQLPAPTEVPPIPWTVRPPHLVAQGWLWFTAGTSKGRLSGDAAVMEYFHDTRGAAAPSPGTWHTFLPLTDGHHVIAADPTRVWLLTLPERSSKETP